MSTKRKVGMALALPLVLTALAGAAKDPTLTYHGYFDDYVVGPVGCGFPESIPFTGVWTVHVPDRDGGIAWLNFQSRMDWGGRPTMFMFERESVVLTEATKTEFSAYTTSARWGLPGDKVLTFTLDSGHFAYTYNDQDTECVIHFNGHQLS